MQNYNTVMCLLPDSGKAVVMLFNMNDYFVANKLSSALCIGVVRLLMGMDAEGIDHSEYLIPHLLISIPLLPRVPYFVAWAFAPDVMLALMSCARNQKRILGAGPVGTRIFCSKQRECDEQSDNRVYWRAVKSSAPCLHSGHTKSFGKTSPSRT